MKKLTKQQTTAHEFTLSDEDEVFGSIRYDDANLDHMIIVELRMADKQGQPRSMNNMMPETYSYKITNLVSEGVLTKKEADDFMAIWRKLRDATLVVKGYAEEPPV
jgi:hypothetical protein